MNLQTMTRTQTANFEGGEARWQTSMAESPVPPGCVHVRQFVCDVRKDAGRTPDTRKNLIKKFHDPLYVFVPQNWRNYREVAQLILRWEGNVITCEGGIIVCFPGPTELVVFEAPFRNRDEWSGQDSRRVAMFSMEGTEVLHLTIRANGAIYHRVLPGVRPGHIPELRVLRL